MCVYVCVCVCVRACAYVYVFLTKRYVINVVIDLEVTAYLLKKYLYVASEDMVSYR